MKEHPFTPEKIAQFFEGTLPETEHTAVLNWFSSLSEEEQLAFMDQHLAALEKQEVSWVDVQNNGFGQIEERILQIRESNRHKGYWFLRIAAVSLPFLLGYFLLQQPDTATKESGGIELSATIKTIRVSNPSHTVKNISLPDSSTVILYPGAEMSYTAGLQGEKRALQLSGKAFFNVKHEEHRPFTVQTGAITTVVLGTSFWIDAEKGAGKISVKVKTGKVGVIHGKQATVFLLPTEMAAFNTTSGVLAKVNPPAVKKRVTTTIEDIPAALVFNETPLRQVVRALSENFKVNITTQDSLHNDRPVSLSTKGKTMEAILQEIKSQIHIDYEIKDNRITIKNQE
ncbi:FecR family protein [Pedobacter sp. AW31-3R]|uniref:FecR family protein n=1 Tax=Pedobacter sp. AW31-3R TaxID=3445781 RepID=UPI003F9F4B7F